MSLPTLTPQMRTEALRKAAQSRRDRAAALARVRAGSLSVAAVLEDKEPVLLKARVRQLLCAVPGVGTVTAARVLGELGIDPERRVAGLGPKQRAALAERFAA